VTIDHVPFIMSRRITNHPGSKGRTQNLPDDSPLSPAPFRQRPALRTGSGGLAQTSHFPDASLFASAALTARCPRSPPRTPRDPRP
jgi:hypothetical protein